MQSLDFQKNIEKKNKGVALIKAEIKKPHRNKARATWAII